MCKLVKNNGKKAYWMYNMICAAPRSMNLQGSLEVHLDSHLLCILKAVLVYHEYSIVFYVYFDN